MGSRSDTCACNVVVTAVRVDVGIVRRRFRLVELPIAVVNPVIPFALRFPFDRQFRWSITVQRDFRSVSGVTIHILLLTTQWDFAVLADLTLRSYLLLGPVAPALKKER